MIHSHYLLRKVITWFLLLISTFYLIYCITAWYKYLGEYKTIYILYIHKHIQEYSTITK